MFILKVPESKDLFIVLLSLLLLLLLLLLLFLWVFCGDGGGGGDVFCVVNSNIYFVLFNIV